MNDFRPVDADNHYYEPLDAFTRHLDPKFTRRGVRVVRDEKQHVQFCVELLQNGQSRDRAPRAGTISFTRPPAEFERLMWDV